MSISHVKSFDVRIPVKIHVGAFEGHRNRPSAAMVLDDPSIRLSGHFQPSDFFVTAQIVGNGESMCMEAQTSYKAFTTKEKDWDEWLQFPVKYCDLPRDASLVLTVWDIAKPRQHLAVGGTSMPLFGSNGCLQEGKFTLKVWEDCVGDDKKTPGINNGEIFRLEEMKRCWEEGSVNRVAWLDSLTLRRVEATRKKEIQKDGLHLVVTLPRFDHPIIYCEVGGDNPAASGLTVMDPEILHVENLVESKHLRITRNRRRGADDRDLKPNPATRDELTDITLRPPTAVITPQEMDMVWRFRYYLSRNNKALTKFLRCVDWNDSANSKQAIELMQKWEPIEVDDALELLGPTFSHTAVRGYAVSRLEKAHDDDLMLYLLQLVQALKYEPMAPSQNRTDVVEDVDSFAMDSEEDSEGLATFPPLSLAGFLMKRALLNRKLGSFFFWYVHVECSFKESKSAKLYIQVWRAFIHALGNGNAEQKELKVHLSNQRNFLAGLRNMMKDLKSSQGHRLKKIEKLKTILKETPGFQTIEPMPLPLEPDVTVTGIVAETAYMFKSALLPLKLELITPHGPNYQLIYKLGDDMRQDQLIIQLILLMDRLLKKENLDLKLTPYRVLATSPDIGIVEFVNSKPIAAVLKEFGNLGNFLKQGNPNEAIDKDIMDTYVKSCAGYCVITYLLGVGDRHFDNLMLCEDGRLFHIDFGYILGRDPKPYPPPMKLTKEMVEAMGGASSDEMRKFRSHAYTAFQILRTHANLILNLFTLMIDSGVQDIALDPDKTVMKVQEKFMLDLSEEEAVQRFQELLDESVSQMFAQFVERVHTLAQYWRK
eukprot:m.29521 g.29521  ORF g.29521 m.29521 type:complete len:822 (+) comp8111_c0_seq1:174-2639(+)